MTGITPENKGMSEMNAERGGEREVMMEVRRWEDRRRASNLRKKGSPEFTVEGSKGERWKGMMMTLGKEEWKRERRLVSAKETVG